MEHGVKQLITTNKSKPQTPNLKPDFMNWTERNIRIAILDLYEGQANQGMRCLREIIGKWGEANRFIVVYDEFDVRLNLAVPDTSYDIYISSGGPGSPLESMHSEWENIYFGWLKSIEDWNNASEQFPKKHVFFICHSFQLACRYYQVGNVCKRISNAFGVLPIHLLEDGKNESVCGGLKDHVYSVESRAYKVIEPDHTRLREMGARKLAVEKNQQHVH